MDRWALDLGDDVVVDDTEITAGEHLAVFVHVNEQMTHGELEVDALHCPVCRHSYLGILAGTRLGRPVLPELIRLGLLSREAILDLVVLPVRARPVAPSPPPAPQAPAEAEPPPAPPPPNDPPAGAAVRRKPKPRSGAPALTAV